MKDKRTNENKRQTEREEKNNQRRKRVQSAKRCPKRQFGSKENRRSMRKQEMNECNAGAIKGEMASAVRHE